MDKENIINEAMDGLSIEQIQDMIQKQSEIIERLSIITESRDELDCQFLREQIIRTTQQYAIPYTMNDLINFSKDELDDLHKFISRTGRVNVTTSQDGRENTELFNIRRFPRMESPTHHRSEQEWRSEYLASPYQTPIEKIKINQFIKEEGGRRIAKLHSFPFNIMSSIQRLLLGEKINALVKKMSSFSYYKQQFQELCDYELANYYRVKVEAGETIDPKLIEYFSCKAGNDFDILL